MTCRPKQNKPTKTNKENKPNQPTQNIKKQNETTQRRQTKAKQTNQNKLFRESFPASILALYFRLESPSLVFRVQKPYSPKKNKNKRDKNTSLNPPLSCMIQLQISPSTLDNLMVFCTKLWNSWKFSTPSFCFGFCLRFCLCFGLGLASYTTSPPWNPGKRTQVPKMNW